MKQPADLAWLQSSKYGIVKKAASNSSPGKLREEIKTAAK
jgi:hypothetical protein